LILLPVSLISFLLATLETIPLTDEFPRLTRILFTLVGPSFGSFMRVIVKGHTAEKGCRETT